MASDAPRDATAGVVRSFSADEGWGVIDAPEVPGGCAYTALAVWPAP
jgi:hypothetical protein